MRSGLTIGVIIALCLGIGTVAISGPDRSDLPVDSLDLKISASVRKQLASIRAEGFRLIEADEMLQAQAEFRRGEQIARDAGAEADELRFSINAANVDLALRRFRDAMRGYLDARERARGQGNHELEAILLTNMSWVYATVGDVEQAELAIEDAQRIAPDTLRRRNLPRVLLQKTALAAGRGDWATARESYISALQAADDNGDVAERAIIMDTYGWELLRRGDAAMAEPHLIEAFRLRKMNRIRIPAESYRNLALLRLASDDTRSAITLIDNALEAARNDPEQLAPWTLYFHRALIFQQAGRRRESLADLEQALGYIEELRLSMLPAETTRIAAGAGLRQAYDTYIDLANELWAETHDPALMSRSFEVAERSRAAGLRAELEEATQARLSDEYWEILGRISEAENAAFRGVDQPADRIDRLKSRLTELEVSAGLDSSPEVAPLATADLIGAALPEQTALIAFHLGDRMSYRWALTREGMELAILPGKAVIENRVRAFRRAVEGNEPTAICLGTEIYQLLFGRLSHTVEWQTDWCLLLDGALFEAPFPALVRDTGDTGPRYLIETHSLRILPGAGLLLQTDAKPVWGGPFVAVSDPVYNRADPRWSGSGTMVNAGPELARLAASSREVQACLRVLHQDGAAPILLEGPNANTRAFQQALMFHPRILHFATHVVMAPDSGRSGRIALSLTPRGEYELLGPASVAVERIRSELVVMSGCASGAGEVLPGEGLLGLTRAWLRAGAQNVAATLWPTSDQSGGIVQAFYRCFEEGDGAPHLAMRRAQTEMIHSGGWKSRPSHWAAYFLVSRK